MQARSRVGTVAVVLAALTLTSAAPAAASFHFMQIEQVAGGVCGDTSRQAIQLRMRLAGQEFVSGKQLKAWDAQGANPIVLITFPTDVNNDALGSRILATTSGFGGTADFMLAQRIPDSYLRAGRLTFEDGFGTIYWSLSWGGGAYVGSNLGDTTNDADGNFGPPVGSRLPFSTAGSLLFSGAAGDPSTNNAADYSVPAQAVWTNNEGSTFGFPSCLFGDGFLSGDLLAWSAVQSGP